MMNLLGLTLKYWNHQRRKKQTLPNNFFFKTKSYVIYPISYASKIVLTVLIAVATLLAFGAYQANVYKNQIVKLIFENKNLKTSYANLKIKSNRLSSKICSYRKKYESCICKNKLTNQLMKTDPDCLFYTGLPNLELFEELCDFISPFVHRRWKGKFTVNKLRRSFKKTPKPMGPERKLTTKDEFLLMLMRLRLNLLIKDLSNRFHISKTLASTIYCTWLRASARVLKSVIYVPDLGILNATKPPQFKGIKELHFIIDATELFIQTPKKHNLQKMTWSNYKHHNTLKILVAVASNSSIIFVSKAYGGAISDKALTKDCQYLDQVSPYSSLMVDKGFNISDECAARNINLIIPPGRRGNSQMLTKDVKTTGKVAKLRILVEQVIRRLKTFRILSTEIPVATISQIDDVIVVCAAICNFQQSIYK